MKNNNLFIATGIFFLIVNTQGLWQWQTGLWNIFIAIGLFVFYIVLAVYFFIHLEKAIKEKLADRKRIGLLTIMLIVLIVVFFNPLGFIDFEKYGPKDVLIAQHEGAANCTIMIKLKENNEFTQREVCFGLSEIRGSYVIKNDTVFFQSTSTETSSPKFAVFQNTSLTLYNISNSNKPTTLSVTKNELP